MKIVIEGNPITKKNHQEIVYNRRLKRFILVQAKAYKAYEREFVKQIKAMFNQGFIAIDRPINLKCCYFMQTKRRVDLSNLINATCDCLVVAGILQDDNCKIVTGFDGSKVDYDKDNPRVEITIEERK